MVVKFLKQRLQLPLTTVRKSQNQLPSVIYVNSCPVFVVCLICPSRSIILKAKHSRCHFLSLTTVYWWRFPRAATYRSAQLDTGGRIEEVSSGWDTVRLIIRKAWLLTLLCNVFGECHAPCIHAKNIFHGFRKRVGALQSLQ